MACGLFDRALRQWRGDGRSAVRAMGVVAGEATKYRIEMGSVVHVRLACCARQRGVTAEDATVERFR